MDRDATMDKDIIKGMFDNGLMAVELETEVRFIYCLSCFQL
jgi:hypothetical protein